MSLKSFFVSQRAARGCNPSFPALSSMSVEDREEPRTPVSPISDLEDALEPVRVRRVDTPAATSVISRPTSPMPPWLRDAVSTRKRQLAASRASESPMARTAVRSQHVVQPSRLTEEHFGRLKPDGLDRQHHAVSDWLDGLPERVMEGWETVLKEEVDEDLSERLSRRKTKDSQPLQDDLVNIQGRTHNSEGKVHIDQSSHEEQEAYVEERGDGKGGEKTQQTFFEDGSTSVIDFCPGAEPIMSEGHSSSENSEDCDDDFIVKILLSRKRLMQAEISVKRLKMGLKHVTTGLCHAYSGVLDSDRTRELLSEVDSHFEDNVRKRLSNATAIRERADNSDEQKQRYRRRLRAMRERDPGFRLRVYTEQEISELKVMVADILGMDERSGGSDGTDWFWNWLPRLLELRGDMAEAEREIQRQRLAAKRTKAPRRSSAMTQSQVFVATPLSVWDLYYYQYMWMQAALNFRPIGSWYAFSIPIEDETATQDWQLRIEQRVWLQEHFSLTLGTRRWLPFRQAMIPAY